MKKKSFEVGVCCKRSGPVRGDPSVNLDSRRGRVLGVMVVNEGVGEDIVGCFVAMDGERR